jgi:hypothetical protein
MAATTTEDLRHALVQLGLCLMKRPIVNLSGWLYWETDEGETGFYIATPDKALVEGMKYALDHPGWLSQQLSQHGRDND